jgi:hypothetical protein
MSLPEEIPNLRPAPLLTRRNLIIGTGALCALISSQVYGVLGSAIKKAPATAQYSYKPDGPAKSDKKETEFINPEYLKRSVHYPFSLSPETEPLATRIPAPKGYRRVQGQDEFGEWLRHIPLKPAGTKVHTYNGEVTARSERFFMDVAGVVDMDVPYASQQCADAIMRLKAEFHFARGEYDKIQFPIGRQSLKYKNYAGRNFGSRGRFMSYLKSVFARLGTASMKRDLTPIAKTDLRIGDMNVQNKSGGIGHIFLIMDIAKDDQGRLLYLLGQSSMPAMDFHIIQIPRYDSPWVDMDWLQARLGYQSEFGAGVYRRF